MPSPPMSPQHAPLDRTRLHELTLAEAAALIRERALSPVELAEASLERIAALDARLHAFITVVPEDALRDARQAEDELRKGCYRGPLHGIPIAHKDMLWTKNIRTTAHSTLLKDWVPHEDATVCARLRDAGVVCLGKTSLHEFACGAPGPDEAFPAARNPWNTDYAPGSSSSGSGAAVAAGLCMAATGTDTGGSVRHPASVCGIVGMKPTFGRVSNHGVIPLAPSLDHVGPMTRTVADNALMLQAMAGHDPKDPSSCENEVPDFSRAIGRSLRGLKIGVPRRFIASIRHDDEVLQAFATAERVFADAGAQVVEVEIPGLDEANEAAGLVLVYEAFRHHRHALERRAADFGATFRLRIEKGRDVSAADYETALGKASALRAAYAQLFRSGVHLLISPGRETAADTMVELLANPARRGLTNRMYNLAGLPALTMPMGFGAQGLPLGLQIAAGLFDEALVYQAAAAYEAATRWCDRHPDL